MLDIATSYIAVALQQFYGHLSVFVGTNHYSKIKRDIGIAHYEKQRKQEVAYPIPYTFVTSSGNEP